MAPGQDATKFNQIILADREKKRKQDLADKIFSRRSSTPAAGAIGSRKPPSGPPSLASRVTKPGQPPKAPRPVNPITGVQSALPLKRALSQPQLSNKRRHRALDAALNGRGGARTPNISEQINIRSNGIPRNGGGPGFTIKGSANQQREYIVMAQNFAPGTSAEDIASVFCPQPEAVGMAECRILVKEPTVIAELTFDNQNGAEDVVKMYNGKKADNRVLYVYHHDGQASQRQAPRQPRSQAPAQRNDDFMEVEAPRQPRYQQPYQAPRPQRAQPDVQDGRYGFGADQYVDRQQTNGGGGLVSDGMIGRGRGGRGGRGGGVGRLFH